MLFKFLLVICTLLQMSGRTDTSNILGLFTSHHRSHMLVYMGAINGLLKRGHNITIITVLPVENTSQRSLRIIQLKRPPQAERMNGIFRQIAVVAANSRVFEDPRFQQFLQEDNQFNLIILGYLFNDYQLGMAAHFSCPVVVIWTTQPISFVNRFIGNPNGWTYVPHPFVRSQTVGLKGILYGVFETIFKWVLDFVMDNAYRKLFPPSKYPTLAQMRKNVSLVLCNHHFSEGPISAQLPSIIEISGIQIQNNKRLPKVLKEFMDSAEHGIIYFSLGTVVSAKELKPAVLHTFLKVFTTLSQRVIWKIDSFPQNFTNIYTSKWFPQSSILAHPNIRLFITHGGKGSRIEALHYAVPMIAIPFFGDQFGEGHRLEKSGFGLKLKSDNITEISLRECIFEVLNNNTYSQNIQIASEIYRDRPLSPEESVIYWMEYVIRHRGATHLQIPTKHMNLIQHLNIDMYLFCICILYIVVIVLKIVVCTLSRVYVLL